MAKNVCPILVERSVSSTQDAAATHLVDEPDLPAICVRADRMTAGRGTRARTWDASPGGLWMTIGLKGSVQPWFGQSVAVAVHQALAELLSNAAVRACVKWPNDILLIDQSGIIGKVSGILVEQRAIAETSIALIGIGINIDNRPQGSSGVSQFNPAVLTAHVSGLHADLDALCETLCKAVLSRAFDSGRNVMDGHSIPQCDWDYLNQHLLRGIVRMDDSLCREGDATRDLSVVGVDRSGMLCVRAADGAERRISSATLSYISYTIPPTCPHRSE